jgi:nucleoside-diphosphate-sugar epimerase
MDILIIGGSRFVGPLLVKRLLRSGNKVTLFNRGLIQAKYRGVDFISGDRNSGFGISRRFDAVVDMCAYEGAQTEMALKELDFGFFLHMSTAAVYRKSEIFPLDESSPTGPWPLWGDYNEGKIECENALRDSGVKYAAVRPVYILGPKNYVNRERFIYSKIRNGEPLVIPGNGEALAQFVFSDEVAECIARILEKRAGGFFNCAGDDMITLKGLAETMGSVMGIRPIYRFNPAADGEGFMEAEFPFANENIVCSNAKIKKLGVRFRPLAQGLKEDFKRYYSKAI